MDFRTTKFVLLIVIQIFTMNFMNAQGTQNQVVRFEENSVYFNTGDSLPLLAMSNPKYQMVVLLFHAEEDTIGLDPGLSVDGRWRAIHLNKLFRDIDFAGYYTTPFRNNILTLQPLVDFKKARLNYYDQADIQALTERIIRSSPSPVIVMVHPETVNTILEQLLHQKVNFTNAGNLSGKMLIVQRSNSLPSVWNEFNYSIR